MARYSNCYPRHGKVAILCEGDLAGYETDLLEKWLALPGGVFVDVWPCGTKTAIYGVSDAIGRAVPVVVIEDRDYRTQDAARKDCEAKKKDRTDRAVNVTEWRTWRRNEIENYLLEPAVAVSVLSEAFGVNEEVVGERLQGVLSEAHVDQAAQWTLSSFQESLPDRWRVAVGLPRKGGRPYWDSEKSRVVGPCKEKVKALLEEKLDGAHRGFKKKAGKVDLSKVLQAFGDKCDEWADETVDSRVWLLDWAGKELLTLLCRWLAGEFGWPTNAGGERKQVDWKKLADDKRDQEMDRSIATVLQPRFAKSLLAYLNVGGDDSLVAEWKELREVACTSGGNGE